MSTAKTLFRPTVTDLKILFPIVCHDNPDGELGLTPILIRRSLLELTAQT